MALFCFVWNQWFELNLTARIKSVVNIEETTFSDFHLILAALNPFDAFLLY